MSKRYNYIVRLLVLFLVAMHSCRQNRNEQYANHEQHQLQRGRAEKKVEQIELNTLLQPSNYFVVSSVPLATIERNGQSIEVDALGTIAYDTRHVATISARYSGRIERLYVRHRFQKVTKGQRVLDIYSPELMTAQQNLLFLLRNDAGNASLISASKQRLTLLGITPSQIEGIIKSGKPLFSVPVFSSYAGHVHEASASAMPATSQGTMREVSFTTEELSLRPGMYIQKGQPIFSVYNPNRVWATLNIYSDMHMIVRPGDAVVITPETSTGKQFRGKISYIEPFFREGSKTITARVYFDNSSRQIPLGSQVKAKIYKNINNASWLPSSAVVSLGSDKVVFIKRNGGFRAQKVITGLSHNNRTQVVRGLTSKDTVAQNAQFLVDSESFIKANE